MRRVNVVVIEFQGLIEDVKVFKEDADAFRFFEEQTGVAWTDFEQRSKAEDSETILGNYAGSNIWETEIE